MMMTIWDMPLVDAIGFIAALVLAYILGYVDGGGRGQEGDRKGTKI